MIFSATLSKPSANVRGVLGDDYTRVKIKVLPSSRAGAGGAAYFAEFFTKTQVFHKRMTERELLDFLAAHEGKTFRSCVERTDAGEVHVLSSRRGKVTRIEKRGVAAPRPVPPLAGLLGGGQNRRKNRVLAEGTPVPFLVLLGVMTAEGKVVSAKRDKFRQLNRFLEFVDDIAGDVLSKKRAEGDEGPLRILDFGSGKSYLTFAMQHYFSAVKKTDCRIFGLDLKEDVVSYCNALAQKLRLGNLSFGVGDIASFGGFGRPDIVVTLHACDTATDLALRHALENGARAVLSVPCCQHELGRQLGARSADGTSLAPLAPLFRHGLLRERFAALLTDAARCEILERAGYRVQVLEFIDDAGTPKNVLIRAVLKGGAAEECAHGGLAMLDELGVRHTLASWFFGERS